MPTVRYIGTDENILSLEALKNMCGTSSKEKKDTKALYLIENLVRVILFCLRITPHVFGTLDIPETTK